MPDIIRPYQRVVTAINPHQANRRFLIPKRGKPGAGTGPSQEYTITAGGSSDVGYTRGSFGTLSPDVEFNGQTIVRVRVTLANGSFSFRLDGAGIADADTVWSQISLTGTFTTGTGTLTLVRASRDNYNPAASGDTNWNFQGVDDLMISGNDYTLLVEWVES